MLMVTATAIYTFSSNLLENNLIASKLLIHQRSKKERKGKKSNSNNS